MANKSTQFDCYGNKCVSVAALFVRCCCCMGAAVAGGGAVDIDIVQCAVRALSSLIHSNLVSIHQTTGK